VKGGRPPTKVRSLMRTPAITATSNMPVAEAIEVMLRRNVGRLPVIDEGNLEGIVSRSNVIRAACG